MNRLTAHTEALMPGPLQNWQGAIVSGTVSVGQAGRAAELHTPVRPYMPVSPKVQCSDGAAVFLHGILHERLQKVEWDSGRAGSCDVGLAEDKGFCSGETGFEPRF
jgi:hypothetical protein